MPMPTSPPSTNPLLTTLGRNVDVYAFKRGWSAQHLATRLGVSVNALNRVRFGRCRYIDPAMLQGLTELFNCSFDDLLLPQPGIDYRPDAAL